MSDISVRSHTGAPAWWGGVPPGPYTGITGKGVVIGIVDTGIDLAHADFRTSTNQTRVKYVWDHTAFGVGTGTGYNHGTQYTEAQINAGSAPQVDALGHGTHMAGIAASNGRATGNGLPAYRYVGMAPEADLIIVKLQQVGASVLQQKVIDGVGYCFAKAESLGKPCVVFIPGDYIYSAATHAGGHDGSNDYDTALSALTAPGKLIVSGVGLPRGIGGSALALHAQVNLGVGASASINYTIPAYTASGALVEQVSVEGWHEPTATFNARLTSPTGITTGWIAPGAQSSATAGDGAVLLQNDMTTNSKGAKQIWAYVYDDGTNLPRAGTWTLELERTAGATTGLLDAWIAPWTLNSGNVSPVFTSNVSNTMLVMSPATADEVIAVGSYTTKTRWQTSSSTGLYSPENPIGARSTFSLIGPRRDGVQRPDLMAPGEGIVSAKPVNYSTPAYTVTDGVHYILAGSSAAAAHVAGAAALLLQGNPTLTPSQARELLAYYSKSDGDTGMIPNATWGYGKLSLGVVSEPEYYEPHYQEPAPGGGPAPGPSLLNNPNALTSMTAVPVVTSVPRPEYLVPLALPGYGTQVTRICGNYGDPLPNIGTVNGVVTGRWGRRAMHHYSKDQPWNDNMSMIWLEQRSDSPNTVTPTKIILDASNYRPIIANRGTSNNHPYLDMAYEVRWRPFSPQTGSHPTQMVSWTQSNQMLRIFDVVSQALIWEVNVPSLDTAGFGFLSEGTIEGDLLVLASSWPDPQISLKIDHFRVIDLDRQMVGPQIDVPMPLVTTPSGKPQQDWVSVGSGNGYYYVVVKYGEVPEYHRCFDLDWDTLICTPRTHLAADHPLRMDAARYRPLTEGWLACMSHADLTQSNSATLGNPAIFHPVVVGGLRSQNLADWCNDAEKKALGNVIAVNLATGEHVHISRGSAALLVGQREAPDQHCSARCYQRPDFSIPYLPGSFVVVTYEYAVHNGIVDHLADEIVIYETKSLGRAYRVGTSRTNDIDCTNPSDPTECDKQRYRAEAHAVPSPDCSKIMFSSNWQRQANPPGPFEDYKAYVIDVPPGPGANGPLGNEGLVHDPASGAG